MNIKINSLVAALALAISVGIAQAEERLSAAQMDTVTAGANRLNGLAMINERINGLSYTLAFADAAADCSGSPRCIADAVSAAIVTANTATAVSSSYAASHWGE